MATITVSLDGQVVQELTLNRERTTIGRRPHNDIVLDMRAVSAEHAAIITILQDSFLEDLGSTNGTQVNGQPVRKHFLQNQDLIKLGGYAIRYHSDGHRSAAETAAMASAFANTQAVDEELEPPVPSGCEFSAAGAGEIPAAPLIRILTGPSAGQAMAITKSLTTIGRPGVQVAVITRRPQGFLITHVEGAIYPLVDGMSIGTSAHPIVAGNVIDLSGTKMEFLVR